MKHVTICPHCHKEWSVELTEDQEILRQQGEEPMVFTGGNPGNAEFFITGICPTCWDEIFKDEEEDE